jgi:hypothetical protein
MCCTSTLLNFASLSVLFKDSFKFLQFQRLLWKHRSSLIFYAHKIFFSMIYFCGTKKGVRILIVFPGETQKKFREKLWFRYEKRDLQREKKRIVVGEEYFRKKSPCSWWYIKVFGSLNRWLLGNCCTQWKKVINRKVPLLLWPRLLPALGPELGAFEENS